MNQEDRFGLLPDENDPLDIMFAVSKWRRESVHALLLQGGRPEDFLQGEFVFGWSHDHFEDVLGHYVDAYKLSVGSKEFLTFRAWIRDSILFAESVTQERIGGQTVLIRKKMRSPMRLKLDLAKAIQAGLSVPEIVEKLGVSQATVYREMKKKN